MNWLRLQGKPRLATVIGARLDEKLVR